MKAIINAYDMERTLLHDKLPLDTPYNINIEPTSYCNLQCNYCVHSLSHKKLNERKFELGFMKWDDFEKIVNQLTLFPNKVKKITFSGLGEPLLHKLLPEMIQLVVDKKIANKVLLNTNGILLSNKLTHKLIDAGLHEIKISLQGVTSEKYMKICGKAIDYNKLNQNINYFSQNKMDCILKVKIPVKSLEEGDKEIFMKQYKDICDFIGFENIYDQFKVANDSANSITDNASHRFGGVFRKLKVCPLPFYRCSILWNGRVTLCQPDHKRSNDQFIQSSTLSDIWNGEEKQTLLIEHLKGNRRKLSPCIYCFDSEYIAHPDDIIDGFEEEILKKLNNSK